MAKRIRRDQAGDPIEPTLPCDECTSADPQIRSRHQLFLARAGLDPLRDHLDMYFAQQVDAERRRGYIDDICHWVASEMKAYGGYVDPHTGAHLPWWDARRQAHELTAAVAMPSITREPGEES